MKKTAIDLVLLDLNMPIKNGWDAFEQLTSENPMLAVIVITARPNQLFTAQGFGVSGLLEKPLDFPTLLESVKRTAVRHPGRPPEPDPNRLSPRSLSL